MSKTTKLMTKNLSGVETAVKKRYAKGAQSVQADLCCPVTYDPKFLKVIPQEILDKDYGCGDPSAFLKDGDTVLDLGSGGGKICYIASQVVGKKGKVIGVDFNPTMLKLAEKHRKATAKKIGWSNVEFKWGRIQDLKTDLGLVDKAASRMKISSTAKYLELNEKIEAQKESKPLIASGSVDVIVSNCVLNLVKPADKKELFKEMYRVLKKGGRVAISDIVSDEEVPEKMQQDPELWSGCISGAFEEKAFVRAFEEAGFYGIKIEKRDETPWKKVGGIEFRSMTVTAYKGKEGACWERNQAVVYNGPFKEILDDDGHRYQRGVRTAVCDKTFKILSKEPYSGQFTLLSPKKEIPLSKAKPFACNGSFERPAKIMKGGLQKINPSVNGSSANTNGACC